MTDQKKSLTDKPVRLIRQALHLNAEEIQLYQSFKQTHPAGTVSARRGAFANRADNASRALFSASFFPDTFSSP